MTVSDAPLHVPTADRIAAAELTRFAAAMSARAGRELPDYDALWAWSIDDLDGFWRGVWDYCEVTASAEPSVMLAEERMPGAVWCPDARLNYAENLLQRGTADAVAIHAFSEARPTTTLTWTQLRAEVARVAAGLRDLGVQSGDRVVAYLPNVLEAIVAMLASASIGAIWSAAAPEFGHTAVVDRFAQIEPVVLFAVDGYRYGGKDFDRRTAVAELLAELPTVRNVVTIDLLADGTGWPALHGASGNPSIAWTALGADADTAAPIDFEQVPFDHPLWVLYSSGTTGKPKAIVQSQGGILLEQLKTVRLQMDLGPDDRAFWYTTTGWMMWNFLVGCLLAGSTIVLYDGHPTRPGADRLWQVSEEAGVTGFGVSAGYVTACWNQNVDPMADGRTQAGLRWIGVTGSPLTPEGAEWTYKVFGSDLWLASISGGTDVCTAFVGAVPTLPVYGAELQRPWLGVALAAWNDRGAPVVDEIGELVITRPMPSMPLYFWGDADGTRYQDSYFDMYPGIWRHGDWFKVTPSGSGVIYGRSDSTINRNGVRMGTSEIYRAALLVPEVEDALVVDVPAGDGDTWMPMFVVLREGVTLDDRIRGEIKARVRADCSPRHVPDVIDQVAVVPRTITGKILEVPVKRILMGQPIDKVVSRDALADPDALTTLIDRAGGLRAERTRHADATLR